MDPDPHYNVSGSDTLRTLVFIVLVRYSIGRGLGHINPSEEIIVRSEEKESMYSRLKSLCKTYLQYTGTSIFKETDYIFLNNFSFVVDYFLGLYFAYIFCLRFLFL